MKYLKNILVIIMYLVIIIALFGILLFNNLHSFFERQLPKCKNNTDLLLFNPINKKESGYIIKGSLMRKNSIPTEYDSSYRIFLKIDEEYLEKVTNYGEIYSETMVIPK